MHVCICVYVYGLCVCRCLCIYVCAYVCVWMDVCVCVRGGVDILLCSYTSVLKPWALCAQALSIWGRKMRLEPVGGHSGNLKCSHCVSRQRGGSERLVQEALCSLRGQFKWTFAEMVKKQRPAGELTTGVIEFVFAAVHFPTVASSLISQWQCEIYTRLSLWICV